MRLSTRSRYGTRLMVDIALHSGGGAVRIADVAKRQGISAKYLEKLVQPLKRAQFIDSRRGPGGGHTLARPLEEITVGAVVRVLEGDVALTKCAATGRRACRNAHTCLTRKVWTEASQAMFDKLDSISLADLVRLVQQGGDVSLGPCPAGWEREP